MRRTTIFAAIFMVATPGLADVTPEQKALAEKSALAVTAFECSVLAEKADDRAEQERLQAKAEFDKRNCGLLK